MNDTSTLVSSNWDRAYRDGKYDQDGPIPFVEDIVKYLEEANLRTGIGYYPGCGNGRNLVPLLGAGFIIEANDISPIAIEQLKNRHKQVHADVSDFLAITATRKYDYMLSIQLFQHVDGSKPETLFSKVNEFLKPRGLFILRVNSIHTQIVHDYSKVSTSDELGFTVQYDSGPKVGQRIHFYSAEEIYRLTKDTFDVVMPLREEFIARDNGTYWAQWETILKKR